MKPEDEPLPPDYRPCVGVAVVNRDGLLLAGQRIDSDWNAWQLPQGGIDSDETPAEASLRELREETGILPDRVRKLARTDDWICYDLPRELIPKLWGGKYRGQKQLWFLYRFIGRNSDVNIRTRHPEFSDWGWFQIDELIEKIVPFKCHVYRHIKNEFRNFLA